MQGLVADIGGTNARFAIVEDLTAEHPVLHHVRGLKVAEHATLAVAIERYLEDVAVARPACAALAVACPVLGDRVRLTNNAWQFSRSELSEMMNLKQLRVMNDFAAQALALPHLRSGQLVSLRDVKELKTSGETLAVLGPGTGLGVAGLYLSPGQNIVLKSEGGHMSFAPLNDLEFEIVRLLSKRYDRISYERLICGQGIRNIYEVLAQVLNINCEAYDPADITRHALAGDDELSRQTLECFCAIFGTFAGDIALILQARHIYIGGGIVPRFIEFFKKSGFTARFESKGRFSDLMRQTPVSIITDPNPGLLGAAASLLKD